MNPLASWNPSDQLLVWGTNVLLQVTLVSVIALVIAASVRRSPALRYAALCASLLLVLLSPAIALVMQLSGKSFLSVSLMQEAFVSATDATPAPVEAQSVEVASVPLDGSTATPNFVGQNPDVGLGPFVRGDLDRNITRAGSPSAFEPKTEPSLSVPSAPADVGSLATHQSATWFGKTLRIMMPPLLLAWFVGSVLLLVRFGISWFRLAAILHTAKSNPRESLAELFEQIGRSLQLTPAAKLVLSSRVSTPFAAGLLRPRVVLPERLVDRMTSEQLRNILVHEIAHIVRRDQVLVLLQNFSAATFWLHPLVKTLNRQLAQAREEVCDNYVLAETDAPSYSRTLLTLSELVQTERPLAGAVGLLTSGWRLERRVAGLLDERRSRGIDLTGRGKAIVVVLSLVMSVIAAFGTMRLGVAKTDKSELTPNTSQSETNEPTVLNSNVSVTGIVLKPDGTPAAGAAIRAATDIGPDIKRLLGEDYETPMSVATTDAQGRFTIAVSTQPYGDVGKLSSFWSERWKQTRIAAAADGFGPAWVVYEEIEPHKPIRLQLVEDMPIRGRIIDLEGRPIPGTVVEIGGPTAAENEDLSKWITSIKAGEPSWTAYKHAARSVDSRLIGTPEIVTTDDDGSFEIRGLGKERIVGIVFEGESVAHRSVNVVTRKMMPIQKVISIHDLSTETVFGTEFIFTAAPTRPIEGIVVDAKTREPLAGVQVQSYKLADHPISGRAVIKTTTDTQGRFRLVGMPKAEGNLLMMVPNDEQPYLMQRVQVPDAPGIEPVSMTIELHRGIWITGRVTDKATGEPVPGVRMHYLPFRTNEFAQALPEFDKHGNVDGDQMRYQTKVDGTYRLVGLPGRAVIGAESVLKSYRYGVGYEAIEAPKEGKSDWLLTYRNPINPGPKWPSVMREINPEEGVEELKIDLELDPGASIKIHTVDENDQPVTGAECDGLSPRFHEPPSDGPVHIAVNFGPDETRSIIFHHKQRNIGRVIRVGPPEIAKDELRVKLLPCATITGRLLSKDEPMPGLVIEPRVLPGGDFSKSLPSVATDMEGRFTCTLIPGCQYNLHAEGKGLDFFATVTVALAIEPGETKDLGTLTLEKDRKFVAVSTRAAPQAATNKPDASPAAKATLNARPITTVIRGTISDAGGKPVADALLAVVAVNIQPKNPASGPKPWGEVLGETTTDGEGRCQFQLTGVTSKTHSHATVIARSQESGIAWQGLDLDASDTEVKFTLQPQQLIQARLVDIDGQPAAGLNFELSAVVDSNHRGEGIGFPDLEQPPRAWPQPEVTDSRGYFTVRNIAPGHGVILKVIGTDRFARQELMLNTGWSEQRGENDGTYRSLVRNLKPGEVATIPIAPAQFFEGVVRLGNTGNPAANTRITMWSSQQEFAGSMVSVEGKTDAQGRFRLNPYPGVRFGIIAYPPQGSPYQVRRLNDLRWDSGSTSKNIEIELSPGVLAHGMVIDGNTNKPLRHASVQYYPERINNKNVTDDIVTGWQNIQKTDESGKFTITVFPGPGTLLVHAAEGNYILQEVGSRELERGVPGGARTYAHAFHKINPKAGESLEAIKIALTPGASITGTLKDPKGALVEHALVISTLKSSPMSPEWRGFLSDESTGKFELTGLREGVEYPVYFLDPKNRLGATAVVSTKNPSPTFVLEPCGSATARFVNPDGKPVRSGLQLGIYMVVTPGNSKHDLRAMARGELLADEDFVSNIDQVNYRPTPTTNANGEVTYPVLIPGARYRFIDFVNGVAQVSKEFVAKSGEMYDMGNIEVEINE